MMHHPNMHHQAMSGHLPAHQGMPPHHQMPHQLHRENRHVTLTRVPLGPSQPGGGMGAHAHGHGHGHGQAMGGMGAMGVPPPHHAPQRPPHPIRAMPHHPPAQHHNVPPQMKQMRRPYLGGGYGATAGVMPPPYAQAEPLQSDPVLPTHAGLCRPSSPLLSVKSKLTSDFESRGRDRPRKRWRDELDAYCNEWRDVAPNREKWKSLGETFAQQWDKTVVTPVTKATSSASTGSEPEQTGGGGGGGGCGGEERAAAGDSEATRPPPQANSKEKTPMCLVNELARYNKIKHQYRLTSETGPAHKKVFTVTLRLGDTEEYTAEGSSIKRAQHAAASSALAATGFPPPPPRAAVTHAPPHPHHRHSVMPTVELNALAMKLCQPAVYTSIPPVPAPPRPSRGRLLTPAPYRMPPFVPNAYQRMLSPGLLYRVRVSVGGRAWLGEGGTPQAARHDAAARALQELRAPGPGPAAPASPPNTNGDPDSAGDAGADLLNSEVKSPVSLVHELALKRNLSVQFTVKSERGPPHMRVFITACTVGDMETEGEGNGKKVSKRRAAERMLDEMRRRWPPALLRARPPIDKRKQQPTKKKPRNLIKEGGALGVEGGGGAGVGGGADNPISRLAVARHAVRARSPQYRVLEERGAARRREFLVQCDAPPHCATGLGPNKKTAKRRAAHNVLLAMEMNTNSTDNPSSPVANSPDTNANGSPDAKNTDIKRKEGEALAGGANSEVRQPVPGVLLMDYHQRSGSGSGQPTQPNGVSETSATGGSGGSTPGAKDQLMYLAQLLGFTVQFSDFPKRNHGEYLSLVSLSTEPPVMCHGGGPSTAHSHEQCSRAALRALALMGLDAPTTAATATATATGMQSMPGAKPGVISNGIAE